LTFFGQPILGIDSIAVPEFSRQLKSFLKNIVLLKRSKFIVLKNTFLFWKKYQSR